MTTTCVPRGLSWRAALPAAATRGPMLLAVPLLIVLVAGGGCATQPKSKLNVEAIQNVAVTQDQLRLRVRALVGPMCGRIEREADAVIAGTQDRDVQLAALTWEIDAVTAMREALYQPEPIVAAVDAMTLCHQMADYFETGTGKTALGPAGARLADACRQMLSDLTKALSTTTKSGDMPKASAFAKQWAADHPIVHSIAERESIVAHMTEYQSVAGVSATERIADVTTTLDDMNRKLEVYSGQLFRQARWEAQRMKLEIVGELHVDQAIPLAERAVKSAEHAAATLDRLSPALERSLTVAQDAPKLVSAERQIALTGVHDELTRTLQVVHDERVAVLSELNTTIVEQRKQIAVEADQIAGRRIDYTVQQITRLLAMAMAAALVMAVAGVLIIRWIPTRRRPADRRA